MKERPILFSAPMVRAILEGRKSQTRRVVKHAMPEGKNEFFAWFGGELRNAPNGCAPDGLWARGLSGIQHVAKCPYGVPGDREWRRGPMPVVGWYYVRGLLDASKGGDDRAVWIDPSSFTWGTSESDDPEAIQLDTGITPENVEWKRPGDRLWVKETWGPCDGGFCYRADSEHSVPDDGRWHPSIHMFKEASRITLEVLNVRVERVKEISEADAVAEGMKPRPSEPYDCMDDPREQYRFLWGEINGPDSWESNSWCWVLDFRRVCG